MEQNKREYFIDWLRIIAVALVVPHHASLTFSHLGDVYVYSASPSVSLYYFVQRAFLNLWFMRILFLLAGISVFYSLKKRSAQVFLRERIHRLLIPTIFAILFICPIMAYFRGLNGFDFSGSLIAFYPEFFQGFIHRYLGWGHFWFLVYLFVFSLILVLILKFGGKYRESIERLSIALSKKNRILIPIFLFMFLEGVFRPFFPGFQNLYADWANFTVYLSFFLLGYILAHVRENYAVIASLQSTFLGLGLLFGSIYIYLGYGREHISWLSAYYLEHNYPYEVSVAIFRGLAEYSWVMFFMGFGKRYLNKNSKALSYFSRNSFALYMYHFVILTAILYYLMPIQQNHFILYLNSTILTYLAFFVLYELVLKRIGFLRRVSGIKKLPKGNPQVSKQVSVPSPR